MRYLLIVIFLTIFHNFLYAQNQKLLLMYDSFVYAKELENAYQVAKIALKKDPTSISWHKKLAQVSRWLGKSDEYANSILYVYHKTLDKDLEEKIVKYFINNYRYDKVVPIIKKRVFDSPNKKNEKELEFIYEMIGEPNEAAQIFETLYKKYKKERYLNIALYLYMQSGNLKDAKKIAKILKDKDINSFALSKYYFLRKDLLSAYKTLLKIKDKSLYKNITFLEYLSDLSTYFHDFKTAAFASKRLFELGKLRINDYEVIFDYYQGIDNKLIKKVSLEAFKKYKRGQFFYNYAYFALEYKLYKDLDQFIKTIKNSNLEYLLKSDSKYWLIIAKLNETNNTKKSKAALKKALNLSPNSPHILSSIIWILLDNENYKELKKMIDSIDTHFLNDSELLRVLALSNLTLQRPKKAELYINKLLKNDPNNIDYKLLKSWQLSLQKNTQAYKKVMREIYSDLNLQIKNDPSMLKKPQFLKQYLKVAIEFQNPDQYKKLLKSSKSFLTKKEYQKLQLAYSWHHGLFYQTKKLTKELKRVDSSLKMDLAIKFKNRALQKHLLKTKEPVLSSTTKIEVSKKNSQISDMFKYTYEGLKNNPNDTLLYKELYDLYLYYGNSVSLKIDTFHKSFVNINSYQISNFHNLVKNYRLVTLFSYSNLEKIDTHKINKTISNYQELSLGVDKFIKDGYVGVGLNLTKTLKSYTGLYFMLNYQFSKFFTLYLDLKLNSKDDQGSNYFLLGGKKDQLSITLFYNILKDFDMELNLQAINYNSLDNILLSKGYINTIKFKQTLPIIDSDFGYNLFFSVGRFSDERLQTELIQTLIPPEVNDAQIVPKNFQILGMGALYNLPIKTLSKSFNPYFDISLLHDIKTKNSYSSLIAGFSKTIFRKNRLDVTLSYNNSMENFSKQHLKIGFKFSSMY